MERPRYLPANRAKAGSLRLGRLSVRTSNGTEVGKLTGFVIDTGNYRIRSLIVECGECQLELPMAPLQLDVSSQSLIVESDEVKGTAFSAESVPHVDVADLWVPLIHSAA
jgi:sporulation protein YlmC with PRC-barrel domain